MRIFLFTLILLLGMAGCNLTNFETGNGDISSEKRLLDDFTEIRLTGNYEISLKKGPRGQVVIVTDSNLMEFIDTEIESEILVIENSRKLHSDQGIKLFVTYRELQGIKSMGASIIKSESRILSDRFALEVPGASLVDLEMDVGDLEVMLAGAGSIKLKGRANNQSVSLRGVGNLEAFGLETASTQVEVSGMGGAEVYVKENLNARVNGVGSIKYMGNPSVVDDQVSGIGTIQAVDSEEGDHNAESI